MGKHSRFNQYEWQLLKSRLFWDQSSHWMVSVRWPKRFKKSGISHFISEKPWIRALEYSTLLTDYPFRLQRVRVKKLLRNKSSMCIWICGHVVIPHIHWEEFRITGYNNKRQRTRPKMVTPDDWRTKRSEEKSTNEIVK